MPKSAAGSLALAFGDTDDNLAEYQHGDHAG
jgi:hypothetical protein